MKKNTKVNAQLTQAWNEHKCLCPTDRATIVALNRRVQVGEVLRVFPNTYIRQEQWNQLNPIQQDGYLIRGLAAYKPSLIFAGKEAAVVHQLEHSYRLHQGIRTITIATSRNETHTNSPRVKRIVHAHKQSVVVDGIAVTPLAQTVADCAAMYSFEQVLCMADTALRKGVSRTELFEAAIQTPDPAKVARVIHCADARSENGGESYMRAVIIECGFVVPELQVECTDPETGNVYRVDFWWRLPDGRIIVGELDGQEKYVNPQMTGGKSARGVVIEEKEREQALYRAGVSRIVRFEVSECRNRTRFANKLASYGIPRMARRGY